jgi:hypothetical protein
MHDLETNAHQALRNYIADHASAVAEKPSEVTFGEIERGGVVFVVF